MTIRLNQITDEGAAHLVAFYEQLLTQNKSVLTHYEAHFNIGLIAWRAGNLPLCTQHLFEAAEHMVSYLALLKPVTPDSVRTPHKIVLPFMVIFNFGSNEAKKSLATLERSSFFYPESARYESLAQMLDVLRAYFSGEKLNSDSVDTLLAKSGHPDADLFYSPWVTTMAQGLRAIIDKNHIMLEKSVSYLLQLHEYLASEGGWEKLAEGLLSFWALTLINVAKQEGMSVQQKSSYVP